jgi:hypothetical protein
MKSSVGSISEVIERLSIGNYRQPRAGATVVKIASMT